MYSGLSPDLVFIFACINKKFFLTKVIRCLYRLRYANFIRINKAFFKLFLFHHFFFILYILYIKYISPNFMLIFFHRGECAYLWILKNIPAFEKIYAMFLFTLYIVKILLLIYIARNIACWIGKKSMITLFVIGYGGTWGQPWKIQCGEIFTVHIPVAVHPLYGWLFPSMVPNSI